VNENERAMRVKTFKERLKNMSDDQLLQEYADEMSAGIFDGADGWTWSEKETAAKEINRRGLKPVKAKGGRF